MIKYKGFTFILCSLICCGNVNAKDSQFRIEVTNYGDFDVFYYRSQSTAGPAVLGGLVGAGIATGVNKSKDTKLESKITNKTGKIVCHEDLLNAFKEKLVAKGDFAIIDSQEPHEKNNVQTVTLAIKDCGYKLANQENKLLAAFVTFKVKIRKTKTSEINLDESFMIKSSKHYQLGYLLENTAVVSSEMKAVLEKAGKRLANKIIYFK